MDSAKIEMTAPVRVLLEAGEGPFCKDHFKISFFVPFVLQVRMTGSRAHIIRAAGADA